MTSAANLSPAKFVERSKKVEQLKKIGVDPEPALDNQTENHRWSTKSEISNEKMKQHCKRNRP